jgi:ABC-type Fe3+-siderophore transport system permease subunit
VVPILFMLGALFMVTNTLLARPVQSAAGLGLLAIGVPVYLYWTRSRARTRSAG